MALGVLATCLARPVPVGAVPAGSEAFLVWQPDGTAVAARLWGDEDGFGIETTDGHTIVRDPASAAWVYAEPDGRGGLAASGHVAGVATPPGVARGLRATGVARGASTRPRAFPAPGPPAAAAVAFHHLLVIVVGFTPSEDEQVEDEQVPEEVIAQRFFASDRPSVAHYWRTVSGQRLRIVPGEESFGTPSNGVVFVTSPDSLPDDCVVDAGRPGPGGRVDECHRGLAREAIELADEWVDFAAFDANDDGYLHTGELHVTVVVRGLEASHSCGGKGVVWGNRNAFIPDPNNPTATPAPRLDGIVVGHVDGAPQPGRFSGGYTQEGEWHVTDCATGAQAPASIGIGVHELGHDLGLPDLYDGDDTSVGVGVWSVMGNGGGLRLPGEPPGSSPAWPDPLSRVLLGFIEPVRIATTTRDLALVTPDVADLPDGGVVMVPAVARTPWNRRDCAGSGEYLLLENRQRTLDYDAGLPGEGLLVWHVDEGVGKCHGVNDDEGTAARPGRRLIFVEQADGRSDLECYHDATCPNSGDDGDPWTEAGAVVSTSIPGVLVALQGPSGPVMTIDVELPVCGNGIVERGETCDDGGVAGGDGCSATCVAHPCWTCAGQPSTCTPRTEGTACDDGDQCTRPDACTMGACVGAPVVCDRQHACATDTCNPATGICELVTDDTRCAFCERCSVEDACVAGPRPSCRTSSKARMEIRDGTRERLVWRWGRGDLHSKTIVPDDHAVCFFGPDDRVLLQATLPAAAMCGTRSCWTKTRHALRYRDRGATASAIARVRLRAGNDRTLTVVAHGAHLPDLVLPLGLPATIQLQRTDATCWQSTFDPDDVRYGDDRRMRMRQ